MRQILCDKCRQIIHNDTEMKIAIINATIEICPHCLQDLIKWIEEKGQLNELSHLRKD